MTTLALGEEGGLCTISGLINRVTPVGNRCILLDDSMFVVAGGDTDPNILLLAERLTDSGLPHRALCAGTSGVPSLTWTLSDDRLSINGATLRPTALFLRYDVFTYLGDRRPESRRRAVRWYQAWMAWVLRMRTWLSSIATTARVNRASLICCTGRGAWVWTCRTVS